MKITTVAVLAGLILAAGQVRSATFVTASEASAIVAREPDGIWEFGGTYIIHRPLPAGFASGAVWKSLDAGQRHCLAVDGTGALFSWGGNNSGQLGTGNTSSGDHFPLPVGLDRNWKLVSAGGEFSTAIKTDGSLWAWGAGFHDETVPTQSSVPLQVGTGLDWKSVTTGYLHRLAIRNDGSLWAWGYNSHGSLGNGTTTSQTAPVRIGTANDWASAACGIYTSFAIKQNGSLWVWGDSLGGFYGDGNSSTPASTVPVQVGSETDWKAIFPSTENNYVLAIKQDGSLWSWGENENGVLGLGNTLAKLSPTRVGTAVDWLEVAPGSRHVTATKTDGSIWLWGSLPSAQIPPSTIPVDRTSLYVPRPKLRIYTAQGGTTNSGGPWTLRTTILNEPTPNYLNLFNDGLLPLSISAINLPLGFTLDATPSTVPPLSFVTTHVRLAAAAKGQYSGVAHILSNQPGLPDFTLNLSGRVVSPQDDSDSDGLDDAAEVALSALGFNWNSTQTTMVETLHSKAEFAGLVPASKIFDLQLHAAAPVINPVVGTARLRFELRNPSDGTSLPLATEALGGPADSGIKLDFPVPPGRDFVRIRR